MAGTAMVALIPVIGFDDRDQAARLGHTPGPPPLVFLTVPLFSVVVFTALAGAALVLRRRTDWHRRLMLAATLNLLPPALGRMGPLYLHLPGLPFAFGVTDLVLLGAAAYDTLAASPAASGVCLGRRADPGLGSGGDFTGLDRWLAGGGALVDRRGLMRCAGWAVALDRLAAFAAEAAPTGAWRVGPAQAGVRVPRSGTRWRSDITGIAWRGLIPAPFCRSGFSRDTHALRQLRG